jgi:hypothetical protein
MYSIAKTSQNLGVEIFHKFVKRSSQKAFKSQPSVVVIFRGSIMLFIEINNTQKFIDRKVQVTGRLSCTTAFNSMATYTT